MASAKENVPRDIRTAVFGQFCQRRTMRSISKVKVKLCLTHRVVAVRNNCVAIRSRIKGNSAFSVFLPRQWRCNNLFVELPFWGCFEGGRF